MENQTEKKRVEVEKYGMGHGARTYVLKPDPPPPPPAPVCAAPDQKPVRDEKEPENGEK